jgi:hypothetical protein
VHKKEYKKGMTTELTRRGFLGLFATAVAATTAAVIVPERRFWQVGTQLAKPSFEETLAYGGGHTYNGGEAFSLGDLRQGEFRLMPIEGQPGLFRDMRTQQVINIRDFRESDKYDILELPTPAANTLFQDQEAAKVSFVPVDEAEEIYERLIALAR